MATMTLQVPTAQIGWFEQMVRSMGWTFKREDSEVENSETTISLAMRRSINKARREYARGETTVCNTPAEMQQYFDSL